MIRRTDAALRSLFARRRSCLRSTGRTLALALLISFISPYANLAQQTKEANESTTTSTKQVQDGPAQSSDRQSDAVGLGRALPPVHEYRVQVGFLSIYFTAVPLAGAVSLIILALWWGRGDIKDRLLPFFGDGQFGQYVVVILVAGNVCSLAIVGILGSSEVAAIYGGIIGYVLGKKTSINGGPPPGANPPGQG